MKGYQEILQVLKYFNNQSQTAKNHCGYKVKLQYIQPNLQQHKTIRRTQNIIWFNPPSSLNVKINVTKTFLQLIATSFPPANKLNKIFNSNTIKVSYNCTENTSQILKGHTKRVTQIK